MANSDFEKYREKFKHNCGGPIPAQIDLIDGLWGDLHYQLNDADFLTSARLFHISYGSWRAAIMCSLAGATSQVPQLLRHSIECALYSFIFSRDEELRVLWWERENDPRAKKRMRSGREGPLAKARLKLRDEDGELATRVSETIEMLIDFGAHPNIFQLIAVSQEKEYDGGVEYRTSLLSSHSERIRCFIKSTACGVDCIDIYDLIWPIRFGAANGFSRKYEILKQADLYFQANHPRSSA